MTDKNKYNRLNKLEIKIDVILLMVIMLVFSSCFVD